ncbi:hypothetical protein B0G83_104458 [Paraburkholderia sp. BL21I4N1]|nr:hypothetical protein B0G83_104458 [Paraburkholderia sp. BL21I4N1]
MASQNDGATSVATITSDASRPHDGPMTSTRPKARRRAMAGAASAPHTMPTP